MVPTSSHAFSNPLLPAPSRSQTANTRFLPSKRIKTPPTSISIPNKRSSPLNPLSTVAMVPPLPLALRPQPQTLTLASAPHFRPFSSSSPHSDPDGAGNSDQTSSSPPRSSSYSSLFSDIKEHLKSPPSPPRRFPDNPSPTPPLPPAGSLDDIRKNLAEFRLRSPNPNPDSSSSHPGSVPSFQQLFKNNAVKNDANASPGGGGGQLSFDSIREKLREFRSSPSQPPNFRSRVSYKPSQTTPAPLVGNQEKFQESIFGKEKEGETKTLNIDFVKIYSYGELGEKLRRLRPETAEKGGKDWFSLEELNVRLAKLRELEEKETESTMAGSSFRDLRESLTRLREIDANKKPDMQKLSMLVNFGISTTPSFMLKPPQEQLLENYYHPDHMSSAEKMKLKLKKVRDEFKISESDCGSARVQVAQLTTKIKHLSSVLHKKDKHSLKGLHEMVQRRKKLLKYLRRTDWDSYCFVLSQLGLRDVPEYKTPDYKTQNFLAFQER